MDEQILKQQLKDLIYKGKFQDAKELIGKTNISDFSSFILDLGFENYSIAVYGFLVSYLLDKENAEVHSLAAEVLSSSLCRYEGAYSIGLFHARKAVELDEENIEYKQFLLLFHDIPDHLIGVVEAIGIAKQILAKKPESVVANQLVDYYKKLLDAK